MEMLVNKDSVSTSYHEHRKSDYSLCLAIHAPRKGIIEVPLCHLFQSSCIHFNYDLSDSKLILHVCYLECKNAVMVAITVTE